MREATTTPAHRDAVIMAALTAWAVAPLIALLVWAHHRGQTITGATGLVVAGDQLRFLVWVKDVSHHLLVSNQLAGSRASHDYLNPMFALSGVARRAGADLRIAYLAWLVPAVMATWAGYRAYARRLLAVPRQAAAALVLALFAISPLLPLLDYGSIVNADGANLLLVHAVTLTTAWELWGYLPLALGTAMLPFALLGAANLAGPGAGRHGRPGATAAAAVLCAWLNPWSGLVALLVLAALAVWRRAVRPLAPIVAALAVPLAYYLVLNRSSPAWGVAAFSSWSAGLDLPSMLAALGPLGLGLVALRRPRVADPDEQVLLLWPVAALSLYVVMDPSARLLALPGLTLPLAVLSVRAWTRWGPRRGGALAIALLTIPGMAYFAHTYRDGVRDNPSAYAQGRHA